MALVPSSSGGSGGSRSTDTILHLVETPGDGPALPIVGVDTGAGTFTVNGDHRDLLVKDLIIPVSGSTGNDGTYGIEAVSYDSGGDTTTITTELIPDPTADGAIDAPRLYEAELVLPENTAVEWVLVLTDVEWDAVSAFVNVGDSASIRSFVYPGIDLNVAPLAWQWPSANFPLKPDNADTGGGSRPGYALYPDGDTLAVQVRATGTNGSAGRGRVIIHHHLTEQGATAAAS